MRFNHLLKTKTQFGFYIVGAITALCLSMQLQAEPSLIPAAPELSATNYILIDADTGTTIVSRNAEQKTPPASLTKIMTSYIIERELEQGRVSMEDAVPISEKAWRKGGSKMYVQEGTTVPMEDILRGIIIQSGNDASIAAAEFIAGTEEAFADLMNQVAKQIGMKNSHFMNATGWPHPEHYTTAQDLAILTQRLIADFPQHYSMYSEKEFTYNNITQPNRNTLMRRDPTVDGVKTGHTEEAGYCLVASKKQDGMRLISVVMGTASEKVRENESQSLLTYGFRFFETTPLFTPGESIQKAKVWAGTADSVDVSVASPVRLTLPRQTSKNIVKDIKIDAPLVAPIKVNQKIGTLRLTLEEKVMGEFPLIAKDAVPEGGLFKRGWDNTLLYFSK